MNVVDALHVQAASNHAPTTANSRVFFPNDSEIDYTNFFKVVKNASSLTALLNETVDWKVKIDPESWLKFDRY